MAVITADGQRGREKEGWREGAMEGGGREASRGFMAACCFTGAED